MKESKTERSTYDFEGVPNKKKTTTATGRMIRD